MEFSVVVPLLDEEESLRFLHKELQETMEKLSCEYEITYVDDGSKDSSLEVLKELKETCPKVKIISFKKRKGQSAALMAGFESSRGKWIVTLDGDLQNPPAEFFKLLEFKDNFDFITGIRRNRKDNFIKKAYAGVAKFFMWLVLGDVTKDPGCSLRLFKKEIVKTIPLFKNFHRFFTFLVKMEGFSVKEVYVNHEKRRFGRSKYGILKRAGEGIFDLWELFWLKKHIVKFSKS